MEMAGGAEEAADEWLIQSLRLYEELHTFELQAPTRVIEWARGNRVCVAGYEDSGGNEILQLLPPPTLQAKETQGLCPERDFKVECGAFSNRPVYGLKHVPDTSLLVTSGPPDSSLQVWQVSAEDSDVIKPLSAIAAENDAGQPWAKIATISAKAPWVLHGSRLNSVQITEVESRKNVYTAGIKIFAESLEERGHNALIHLPDGDFSSFCPKFVPYESAVDGFSARNRVCGGFAAHVVPNEGASRSSEELSDVAFLDGNTALLCCAEGRLSLADVRQPQAPLEAASVPWAPCDERWRMGVAPQGSDSGSRPVARLSSGGHLSLTDVRKTSESLAWVKCPFPRPSSGVEFLRVSWAPALRGCLAVSGFDGTVHVYDTQRWDSSGQEAEPIFIHKGHAFGGADSGDGPPLVTSHTWHPQRPRTLLSAASDGSLHVWEWVRP